MKHFNVLQLFAYNPQAQPANNIAVAGQPGGRLSPENQTYYDMQLIRYAKPKLVHQQFGQKRDIPAKSGQKINFRSFASLGKALTPLVEGVTPDGQNLSVTEIEAKPKQYGDFVAYTDYLDMTAIDPVVTETVTLIGDQAGITCDTIVRDEINTGTNVGYASKVVGNVETPVYSRADLDATAAFSVDTIEKAVTELRAQNAPTFEDGRYVVICHPYALYDLRKDKRWIDAQQFTANVTKIYEGEAGIFGGARIVTTTEAKIFAGADLSATSRNLTAASASGTGNTTVTVSQAIDANALAGRFVLIGGKRYEVASNTAQGVVTLKSALTSAVAQGDTIYPGEGGANGIGVFSCLFLGKNAYGVTEIGGGGMRTIIKPLGSGGSSDPLEQRATIGWKALLTAKILVEQYIRRVECGGTYATANLKAN